MLSISRRLTARSARSLPSGASIRGISVSTVGREEASPVKEGILGVSPTPARDLEGEPEVKESLAMPKLTSQEEFNALAKKAYSEAAKDASILEQDAAWNSVSIVDPSIKFKILLEVSKTAGIPLPGSKNLVRMQELGEVAAWGWASAKKTIDTINMVEEPIPAAHVVARYFIENAETLPSNLTFIPHVRGRARDIRELIKA